MVKTVKKKDMVTIGDRKTIFFKLFLSAALVFLFQALSYVPTPFVKHSALKYIAEQNMFDNISFHTGQAFQNFTLMATGISSYITASIVMQMITHLSKTMYDVSRSPGGQKKIKNMTIVLGMIVSFISSIGITLVQHNTLGILNTKSIWLALPLIAIYHMMGTGIAIWIGETITEKAYGNGMSLLILTNILARIPGSIVDISKSPKWYWSLLIILVLMSIVILIESSYYNIKLVYSRALARGDNRFAKLAAVDVFPLKVNMSGIMPVILASSILQILSIVLDFSHKQFKWEFVLKIQEFMSTSNVWAYSLIMVVLIIVINHFYSTMIFDPIEIAENFQKSEALVENINPGNPTLTYLRKVSKGLTRIANVYIAVVVLLPTLLTAQFGIVLGALSATSLMILISSSSEIILQVSNEWKLNKVKI